MSAGSRPNGQASPIFVRFRGRGRVTVEVIEQTGHLVECLLIAVDVSHGQHVFPFPIEVKGIAVAD